MVQKATPDAESRGRRPSFDEEQVVTAAVEVFWRCGYDGASVSELESELGVNRSTLYNSFDGKAGLFDAAVARYMTDLEAVLLGPLFDGTDGITDLIGFADRYEASLTDRTMPAGCLMVNAMVAGDAPEAVERYLTNARSAFDAALARAAELGEVSDTHRRSRSGAILSAVIGLSVIAKTGASSSEIDELVNGLRTTIQHWQIEDGTGPSNTPDC